MVQESRASRQKTAAKSQNLLRTFELVHVYIVPIIRVPCWEHAEQHAVTVTARRVQETAR